MNATTPKAFPSMVDHLVEQMFQRMLSGDYGAGSRITEEQIAAEFGASRTPVREAVRRLAELDLLVVRPRCGLEVASIEERDVGEIRDLRAELETLALRLAMQNMTDEKLAQLEQIQGRCEKLLDADNRLAVFREDSNFHLTIAQLSVNRHLLDTLRRLDAKVLLCRMMLCRSPETIRATVLFHRTILSAVREGAVVQATTLLREHIEKTQM